MNKNHYDIYKKSYVKPYLYLNINDFCLPAICYIIENISSLFETYPFH